jgi:hypothetical protein
LDLEVLAVVVLEILLVDVEVLVWRAYQALMEPVAEVVELMEEHHHTEQ